jgi:hypothetical protein
MIRGTSLLGQQLGLVRRASRLLTHNPARAKRSWTHGTLGLNQADSAASATAANKPAATSATGATPAGAAAASAAALAGGAPGSGSTATMVPAASVAADKPKSKFWTMFREYGTVFVAYWGTCWLVCFVPIYGAIQYHLVHGHPRHARRRRTF